MKLKKRIKKAHQGQAQNTKLDMENMTQKMEKIIKVDLTKWEYFAL